jgi:hypothetical protein
VTEYRSLLERAGSNAPPLDLQLERVLRRRDRKRRNQRIGAGVVGIAVFVTAMWIVTSGLSFDRTQRPANEPSTVNSAEDVARGFLAAFGAFDTEAAMTYVADDADLQGLIYPETSFVIPSPLVDPAAGRENFRMMLDLMEAAGYQQTITSCQAVSFGSGTGVVCGFDFDMIGSDELGLGPVTGNRFLLTVADGEIVRAWVDWDTPTVSAQLVKPFRDWVSATHPKDVRVMFGPPPKGAAGYLDPRYTNESIRLWRLRIPEYVKAMQATAPTQTAPPPAHASAAPDVVNRGPCRFGFGQPGEARSWLELTDLGDRIKVRFEVFRSPVGHSWRIVLRHDHTTIPVPDPDSYSPDAVVFFRGTRVASEDGEFVVQRRVWGVAGSGFYGLFAEATDRQTELVCKAFAYIG